MSKNCDYRFKTGLQLEAMAEWEVTKEIGVGYTIEI